LPKLVAFPLALAPLFDAAVNKQAPQSNERRNNRNEPLSILVKCNQPDSAKDGDEAKKQTP